MQGAQFHTVIIILIRKNLIKQPKISYLEKRVFLNLKVAGSAENKSKINLWIKITIIPNLTDSHLESIKNKLKS